VVLQDGIPEQAVPVIPEQAVPVIPEQAVPVIPDQAVPVIPEQAVPFEYILFFANILKFLSGFYRKPLHLSVINGNDLLLATREGFGRNCR